MNVNSFFHSVDLTYYFMSFLCKAMLIRYSFDIVSTNSSDAHVYEHACSQNNSCKIN